MDGWRLGLLIAMIAIFFLVLGLYALIMFLHSRGWVLFAEGGDGVAVGSVVGNSSTLYFRDAMTQQLHSIDLRPGQSADDFRIRVAALCGRHDVASIALSRVDEGNVLVELDLERFFASPTLAEAAKKSALEPLVLSRHFPVRTTSAQHSMLTTPRRHVEASMATMMLTPRKRNHVSPHPFIFPDAPLVTTKTFIIVSAAAFLDSNTGEYIHLTDGQAHALEWAFVRDLTSAELGDGLSASISAKYHEATIHYTALQTTRRIQRLVFRRIQYAIDSNGGSGDAGATLAWSEYTQPFRLPLGRWCVRVQASTDDDRTTESVARVFTVEASVH